MKISKIISTIIVVSSTLSSSTSSAKSNFSISAQVFTEVPGISKDVVIDHLSNLSYNFSIKTLDAVIGLHYSLMQSVRVGIELSYLGFNDHATVSDTIITANEKDFLLLSVPKTIFVATIDIIRIGPASFNVFAGTGFGRIRGMIHKLVDNQNDTPMEDFTDGTTTTKYGAGLEFSISDDIFLTLSGYYSVVDVGTDNATLLEKLKEGKYGSYNIGLGLRCAL